MDPIKIIIFIVAFVVLLLIGRMLSSSSEVHAAELPHPAPQSGRIPAPDVASDADKRPHLALTGAEIEFPIQIPPVTQQEDGTYNRPDFTNYYFSKTDLVRGPADPSCFCDEFFLEAQDPGSKHVWEYQYTVATPSGLRQVMDAKNFASLYFDNNVVIVARWDLSVILQTVTDEIMQHYGNKAEAEESDK